MDFSTVTTLSKRKKSDLLVIPFFKDKTLAAAEIGILAKECQLPITVGDFLAKEGEVQILYSKSKTENRIALLGLGCKEEITVEKLRRAYSCLLKAALARKIKHIAILLPELNLDGLIRGISEGLLLSNYSFNSLKSDTLEKSQTTLVSKCSLIGATKNDIAEAKKARGLCEGVYLTRDLINGNADDVTPQALAQVARNFSKEFKDVKTTVFDKKRIEKEKMGLLLAVNRGSSRDPTFIIVEYKGNPASTDHTVIVGKGVTYDTGGLNLKPTGSMETMKADMGGSAAVLGAFYAAAKVGLKKNITAVIPSTENCIGRNSYKPGDVYPSYAGKTVEIGNTDAEGRLVLADALSYSVKKLKPTRIVDIATLTGAKIIALGAETIALMSNDDSMAEGLSQAGENTFERAWRMPLFEEYKPQLQSDVADIKNTGGRAAGTITAALFLQEFVGNVPWAHLDIAGSAFLAKSRRYNPKNASGVGVRLLFEFIENLKS